MVDFKKIDEMIELIEKNEFPKNSTNNEFFIDFFNAVHLIPLSKYLRGREKTNKLPKIMNSKKAGEILIETSKSEEIKTYLKRKGYPDIPQLNYTTIMLLRKVDLYGNWDKIISFLEGKGTIGEINLMNRKQLLPQEIEILENHIKENLSLTDKELNWLLNKLKRVESDKELSKSLKKLVNAL